MNSYRLVIQPLRLNHHVSGHGPLQGVLRAELQLRAGLTCWDQPSVVSYFDPLRSPKVSGHIGEDPRWIWRHVARTVRHPQKEDRPFYARVLL